MPVVFIIDIQHLVFGRPRQAVGERIVHGHQRRPCQIRSHAETANIDLPLQGEFIRETDEKPSSYNRIHPSEAFVVGGGDGAYQWMACRD